MTWRILLVTTLMLTWGICGCSKKSEPVEPSEPTTQTVDEMKAEAEEDITAENLDDQLDKMEAEINSDEAAEN